MPGIAKFYADHADDCDKIEVGDFVRSYDFEFHDDCYVEGKVVRITEPMEGCERYEILRLKRIFNGEQMVGERRYFYPPVNGTPSVFDGYINCVRKVDEEAAEYWRERLADWASDVEVS